MSEILFCVDSESARHPGLVGLGDERFEALPWMQVCSTAVEARDLARDGAGAKEVWVASSDDMDAFNLAAAISGDNAEKRVVLIIDDLSGSAMSRAHMAGVESVLDCQAFAKHYAKVKRAYAVSQANLTGTKLASSIVITGASGGCGRSSIAALTAVFAAKNGLKTLLIDADLQYGDCSTLMKGAHELLSSEVLADLSMLAGLPSDRPLVVTVPPARLEQAESLACELPTLLDLASTLFDVVVVNAHSAWDDTQISLIERSAKTLFVVDQRASSVRAARRALDLCVRCGIATGPVQFALNRCSKTALYSALDVSCALQGASVVELRDGGREVEELLGVGLAEDLLAERNPFAESLASLLAEWLPIPEGKGMGVAAKASTGSLFERLKAPARGSRRRDVL